MADGDVLPRIAISSLLDELFVEIFNWCRLDDEYGWNYRRQWYNPLFTFSRVTQWMPLSLGFKEELLLTLQRCDRASAVSIDCYCWKSLDLWKALDKTFPMLEILSLSDPYGDGELSYDFAAPHLRVLHLQNTTVSTRSLLLTSATNLLSLRLECINTAGYLPPEYLIERIACMPHLENMSISFYHPDFRYRDMVTELPDTQDTRVVLPRLSRLIYNGFSAFLGNLLARISTPLLQDFRFTPFLNGPLTVYYLPAFLDTIQNLNLRTAVVSFSTRSVTVAYYPEQPSVSLPYLRFHVPSLAKARAATSAVQICSSIGPALPVIENLELMTDYRHNCSKRVQFPPWYAFLRSFGGVRTLRVDMTLAKELSRALDLINGAVIKDLLPVLSELVVVSEGRPVHQPFSSFIHARRLSGQSIDLRITQDPRTSWKSPPISWSFDTFNSWTMDHWYENT